MARICPVTKEPVLYPDCQECEWKRQCRQGFPGGLQADHDTKTAQPIEDIKKRRTKNEN